MEIKGIEKYEEIEKTIYNYDAVILDDGVVTVIAFYESSEEIIIVIDEDNYMDILETNCLSWAKNLKNSRKYCNYTIVAYIKDRKDIKITIEV